MSGNATGTWKEATHFGATRVSFRLLRKLVNVSASPTLELTLIEPSPSTEYGPLYVAQCVPGLWQTMLRLQFRRVKL